MRIELMQPVYDFVSFVRSKQSFREVSLCQQASEGNDLAEVSELQEADLSHKPHIELCRVIHYGVENIEAMARFFHQFSVMLQTRLLIQNLHLRPPLRFVRPSVKVSRLQKPSTLLVVTSPRAYSFARWLTVSWLAKLLPISV